MACSLCGKEGHDKRTCPNKNEVVEKRNKALSLRVDNLTEEEQSNLHMEIVKIKKKIAPEARATLVEGDEKEIGTKILQQLMKGQEE